VRTLPPHCLGRYQIEAEIGRGAMGVVYRARDPKIDRPVAIKTISLAGQEPEDEQEYRERFLQEARAAGRLSHPGIVTVFDAGEDPETHEPYLVMELVAGEPLSKIMPGPTRKLPLHTTLQFAHEIAEALQYAHSRGVIHRDIKPANILVTAEGRAKIADFGVARLNHTVTTRSGQIFGSPAYMAPEQLSGGEADARSDLFSLGVMLYSMITGFRPFQGNSAETVCFKVMNVEPVPVTSLQAELQPELDRIVSRAIAKEPGQRYQSGAEMASAIQAFLRSDEAMAEATSFFTRTLQQGMHEAPGRRIRSTEQNRAFSMRFLWQAGIATLLIAWVLTGWQLNKDLRQTAEIQLPSIPVPPAPAVQKSQKPRPHLGNASYRKKAKQPPPVQTAKMRVEILHHFIGGKASIWLDRQLVLDQDLHGDHQRHPIFRTLEINQVASLQFASGKHKLEVRVVAPGNTYDQSETLDADLTAGPEHVLLVNCDKRKMQVTLQ
jgi:serine/threonine protein kinase